ncbi:MAG: hypothetical protein K2K06_00720 [Oscillospiraceae bacterium]|nr:hypothetical protein [Oscillospiraceae bacterium]
MIAGGPNSGKVGDTNLFSNLIKQPPEYNQNTWTTDFNNFFKAFSVNSYDNSEGSIIVNFSVSDEYALASNGTVNAS